MSVIHPKKHPQSILGFFGDFFAKRVRCVNRPHGFSNGITEWDYNEFLQEAQAFHVIGQRAHLENYLDVRQALPCAAISSVRDSDGAEVFWLFQRTAQVGEEKLVGMTACFWGGHVDGVDAVFDEKSRLDLEKTLTVGRDREQGEEYRIYRPGSPFQNDACVNFPLVPANLFIANSTVEVDKYHVAIVYNIKLPVGYAVQVLEKELIGIETPMSAQEALDAHEAGTIKLESWAQIYFRHVRAQELLDSGAVVATEPFIEAATDIGAGVLQAHLHRTIGKPVSPEPSDEQALAALVKSTRDLAARSAQTAVDELMRVDPGMGSGLSDFLAERLDSQDVAVNNFDSNMKFIGEGVFDVAQQIVDAGVKVEFSDEAFQRVHEEAVMNWDHGPYYDAYVARGGKEWEEFKQKVLLMFGINTLVWETPGDANATDVFPDTAARHPFFFQSASGQHTVAEMLSLVDAMMLNDFKDRVLVHADFTDDMELVGEPYRKIKGQRVPLTNDSEKFKIRALKANGDVLFETEQMGGIPLTRENLNAIPLDTGLEVSCVLVGFESGIKPEEVPSHLDYNDRGGERLDNALVPTMGGEDDAKIFVDPQLVWSRDVMASGDIVTTAPVRFDTPLPLGSMGFAELNGDGGGFNAKARVSKVYLQLTEEDGTSEVIGVPIGHAVHVHDEDSDDEEVMYKKALFNFTHPVLLSHETSQYHGLDSATIPTVLGDHFSAIGVNFQVIGKMDTSTGNIMLTKEGPHMVGFTDFHNRTFQDGDPLPPAILEAASGILYLKMDLIGADLVFEPA